MQTHIYAVYLPFIILGINCCDHLLYILSDNTVCQDENCLTETNTLISIGIFQTICFQLRSGGLQKFRLTKLYKRKFFKPLYTTSSWDVSITSHSRCYQAGSCDSVQCTRARLVDDETGLPSRKTNSSAFKYSGCTHNSLPCPYYCGWARMGSCTWYVVEVVPKGKRYTVYGLVETSWEIVLSKFDSSGSNPSIILSSENPTYSDSSSPITVVSVESNSFRDAGESHTAVVLGSHFMVQIPSSSINQPIINNIGEIQMQLNGGDNVLFPILQGVNCHIVGCEVTCDKSEPSVDRVIKPLENLLESSGYDLNRLNLSNPHSGTLMKAQPITWMDDTAIIMTPAIGHVNLLVSTPKIENSLWNHPVCDFKILYAMGCIGCSTPVKIGIQAVRISNTGTITIKSNCSVSRYYLSCQSEPYEITAEGNPTFCSIDIERTMKSSKGNIASKGTSNGKPRTENMTDISNTIVFKVNYIFEGGIDNIKILQVTSTDPSLYDKVALFTSSPSFKFGLGFTFIATTGFFGFLRTLSLVFSWWGAKKLVKESSASN